MSTDRTSPGCGLTLTSERLSLIPKRNIQQFLQDYTQNQRRFSKSYTLEADHAVDGCGPVENRFVHDQQFSERFKNVAFGTPVLKPRVPILAPIPPAKTTEHITTTCEIPTIKPPRHNPKMPDSNVKETEASTKKRPCSSIQEENKRRGVDNGGQKSEKRRVHANTDSNEVECKTNDDRAKRLEDRRQRRKSKKEIMQPPMAYDSSGEEKKTKPQKKKKNQTKNTQIGFALMHGFTATNVGKNRLTLDSISRDVGVFQKGKASMKTTVSKKDEKEQGLGDVLQAYAKFIDKPSGNRRPSFSETKFLNSKPSKKKDHSVSTGSSSTPSGVELMASSEKEVNSKENPSKKKDTKRKSQVLKSPVSRTRTPYDPAESVIWDIERDSNAMLETGSDNNPTSILLRCPSDFVEALPKPKAPHRNDNGPGLDPSTTPTTVSKGSVRASSPIDGQSLAPSQSASQVVVRRVQAIEPPTKGSHDDSGGLSKYFQKNGNTHNLVRSALPPLEEVLPDLCNMDNYPLTPQNDMDLSDSHEPGLYVNTRPEDSSTYDGPMQDQHAQHEALGSLSPRSPMDIVYDHALGYGVSESYVLSSPHGPGEESLSMYCPSPLPFWVPSTTDNYSLEVDHNGLICDSLQGDHQCSTNLSDIDWKENLRTADHLPDVDRDCFLDTNIDGQIDRPAPFLGSWDAPQNFDDLGDFCSQWHYDAVSHDGMPSCDDEDPHGYHNTSETNRCSTGHFSECSFTGSGLEKEEGTLGENFRQGRDLLHCYNSGLPTRIFNAEAEVAGLLKERHWTPHRF